MIKQALMISAGAAAGWFGHRAVGRGRDAAALRAEQTLRTTLHPANLGRHAGSAAATALVEGARGFAGQLRQEVPAWRTQPPTDHLGSRPEDNVVTASSRPATDQPLTGEVIDEPTPTAPGRRAETTASTSQEHTA
ncbi:hypothetical protein HDA30_000854 [Micrococcus cohnii]|uniref:Uncharacterized protein n=1 Tax=Micrococcus cohnii TaxID=993416 RepID=A0A7W7M335_9MICC|nr:hypothetical protein [Micrococcus cohnii]MBB4735346.1 hypothetical protein [Micrococcus cohnii]